MINYGEELAYWHLRLNGCFLKTDFVLHRGEQIKNSSDNDVLAVRPIFGSEPLLEAPKDYDKFICDHTDQPRFLGIICQVKTGAQVSGNTNCLRQYLLCSIFPRADWQNRRGSNVTSHFDGIFESLLDQQLGNAFTVMIKSTCEPIAKRVWKAVPKSSGFNGHGGGTPWWGRPD